MDVIAMQTANKVLKRMNTEFNGMYDTFVAVDGQKLFSTSKIHDTENHSLHVYVNGFHAVDGQDYVHKSTTEIEFKSPLRKGDVVLLATQIVGVPKFEIVNPAYDDSTIRSEITSLQNRINAIHEVLDDDKDGSIVDTISNLKKLWEDADGELIKLVEACATKEELKAVADKIAELEKDQSSNNNEELVNKVAELERALSELSNRVDKLEDASNVKDLFMTDSITGRKHKLILTSGSLSAQQVGDACVIEHTAQSEAIINQEMQFRLNILANADLNQKVKLLVSHNNSVSLEYNDGYQWREFTTRTIDSLTNLGYTMRLTGLATGTHEVKFDIVKYDNNAELATVAFSVVVKEQPSATISGNVTLVGADASLLTINVKRESESEVETISLTDDGSYTHKVFEAGTYEITLDASGVDTHTISGNDTLTVVVELGQSYENNNFALVLNAPPIEEPGTGEIEQPDGGDHQEPETPAEPDTEGGNSTDAENPGVELPTE